MYVVIDMHAAPEGQTGANIDDSWGYPWIYDSPQLQPCGRCVKRIAGTIATRRRSWATIC